MTDIKPGIYPDMDDETYFSLPLLHSSLLKYHLQSPSLVKHHLTTDMYANPGMKMGTALHWAVLEPDLFDANVVKGPNCKRSDSEWSEFCAEQAGKLCLTAREYGQVMAQLQAIAADSFLRQMLGNQKALREVVFVCECEFTGLMYGIKVDFLFEVDNRWVSVDLKGCTDSSMTGFYGHVETYDYYFQAAMYLKGMSSHGYNADWAWLAVNRAKPIMPAMYWADPVRIERSVLEFHAAMTAHAECLESGKWPGPGVRVLREDGMNEPACFQKGSGSFVVPVEAAIKGIK